MYKKCTNQNLRYLISTGNIGSKVGGESKILDSDSRVRWTRRNYCQITNRARKSHVSYYVTSKANIPRLVLSGLII